MNAIHIMKPKIYTVRDDENVYGSYLREQSAQGHFESIKERFPEDSEGLVIESEEIAKIANQSVVIEGSVIGFQFSQTKNGKRTLHMTVHELAYTEDMKLIGRIKFNGTWYDMVYDWLFKKWFHISSQNGRSLNE